MVMTPEQIQGNGEHVLVVEDDPIVRNMTMMMASCLGYSVAEAASGEEAVRYLGEKPAHLVLLDMQMGTGINGRETYERILAIRPGQRAIVISGYSESVEIKRALELGVSRFVEKPFTLFELGEAMKTALYGHTQE